MKKYFSILFLFAILSITVSAQDSEKQIDPKAADYYNKSVEALKADNLKDAEAFIDSGLAVSKDSRLLFIKGQIAYKKNDWNNAITQYEEIRKQDKNFEQVYAPLAAAYTNNKQYDQAIAVHKDFISITKDEQKKVDTEAKIKDIQSITAVDLYNEGLDLSKNGKNEEALAKFDKALEINKDAKTYYAKGVTYSKMQKYPEAIEQFKTSVSMDSTFDLAYYMLGSMYMTSKNYKDAIPNLTKASEITTNDALKNNVKESLKIAYLQQGLALYKEKKLDAAMESFNKSLEQAEYDQAYLQLARVQIDKKKYDEALANLDKALEVKKSVTEGQVGYYKGTLYKAKGDKAKAIQFFKAAGSDKNYKKAADSEIANINAATEAKK